jgi:hypothetical protein
MSSLKAFEWCKIETSARKKIEKMLALYVKFEVVSSLYSSRILIEFGRFESF